MKFHGDATARVNDASGHEVPYLVVAPPDVERAWRTGRVVSDGTKAFECDFGVDGR